MINQVFAIRDKHAGFGTPFVDTNEYTAKRGFAMAINNNNSSSIMAFAPSDYDLYLVGTWNTENAKFTPCDNNLPVLICNGASLVTEKE